MTGDTVKNTNFKVQRSLLAIFMYHDLDEIIATRPAANHYFRNPAERCHCIANMGLQAVGIKRSKQNNEFETCIVKGDGNADVQKECESSESFLNMYKNSLRPPRELLEKVLGNLSLEDEPFPILQSATRDVFS